MQKDVTAQLRPFALKWVLSKGRNYIQLLILAKIHKLVYTTLYIPFDISVAVADEARLSCSVFMVYVWLTSVTHALP